MKKTALFIAGAMVFVAAAQAQSTTDAEQSSGKRPEMGTMFFRPDERRILEAIRQGVVAEEGIDLEEFNQVPILLVDELNLNEADQGDLAAPAEQAQRGGDLSVDALIRNRTKNKTMVLINGELINISEPNFALEANGLSVDDSGQGSGFEGSDSFSQSKFRVQVGQVIGVDGQISERLPIVRKSRKKN